MKSASSYLLSVISAFAFSFATDLIWSASGRLPQNCIRPGHDPVSDSDICTYTGLHHHSASPEFLGNTLWIIGTLALLSGVVEIHPHSYGVAILLYAQPAIICRVAQPSRIVVRFKIGLHFAFSVSTLRSTSIRPLRSLPVDVDARMRG